MHHVTYIVHISIIRSLLPQDKTPKPSYSAVLVKEPKSISEDIRSFHDVRQRYDNNYEDSLMMARVVYRNMTQD